VRRRNDSRAAPERVVFPTRAVVVAGPIGRAGAPKRVGPMGGHS
jgi:hypothetical protein